VIQSLRLQHFRSYRDDSFEFEAGVNIVVGPNASGKTNLLEAILLLCQGSSFRARDTELISFKAAWARLEASYSGGHSRVAKLDGRGGPLIKEFIIDDKPFRRLSLERTFPVVLFEPQHLQLLVRGPEGRRDYLDDLLARSRAGFKSLANAYKRTLAQRNSLLKKGRAEANRQLFAWDVRLSELGGQIAAARAELVADINKSIAKTYSQIARTRSRVAITYQSQFAPDRYSTRLLAKLESSADTDLALGFTAYGPHREDFSIELNGHPAAAAASRGETRSLLLALKIYELARLEKLRGQKPIFLLDDVFSELDSARRQALVEHLSGHQTIITTTDADAVIEYFADRHHLIPLS